MIDVDSSYESSVQEAIQNIKPAVRKTKKGMAPIILEEKAPETMSVATMPVVSRKISNLSGQQQAPLISSPGGASIIVDTTKLSG